jgi:hypothetical protein
MSSILIQEPTYSVKDPLRKRKDTTIASAARVKRLPKQPETFYPLHYGHALRDM